MCDERRLEVFVTHVETAGHFIKLWVQLSRGSVIFVEKLIKQYTDLVNGAQYIPHPSVLNVGNVCCAKYVDGVYYRAQILNLSGIVNNEVFVHFLDYGNNEIVPLCNIRNILPANGNNVQSNLTHIPPQATEFFLAGVIPIGGVWTNETVEFIRKKLCYEDLKGIVIGEIAGIKLLSVFDKDGEFSSNLVHQNIAISIAINAQQILGQSLNPAQINPRPVLNQLAINWHSFNVPPPVGPGLQSSSLHLETMRAIRSNAAINKVPTHHDNVRILTVPVLEINSEHAVYVSFVEDGPSVFTVQLKAIENDLIRMSNEINNTPQQPMLQPLLPGSICLGRFSDDKLLCRAVVMGVKDDKCKLYYVDFGNSEILSYSEIYVIPQKYLEPKSMALRFALSGIRNITVSEEVKELFKKIVLGKVLKLKVVSPEGPPVKQYCELYLDGKSVKEILNESIISQQLSSNFTKMVLPNAGESASVVVSYVENINNFFVQLETNLSDLTRLMNFVSSYCSSSSGDHFKITELQVGMPCCALYNVDDQWYRAKIKSFSQDYIEVSYVDFGNCETVTLSSICKINSSLINQLPEQAIHCSLHDVESNTVSTKLSELLETFTTEKTLHMKVVNRIGDKVVADLFDLSVSPPQSIKQLLKSQMISIDKSVAVEQPNLSSYDDGWNEGGSPNDSHSSASKENASTKGLEESDAWQRKDTTGNNKYTDFQSWNKDSRSENYKHKARDFDTRTDSSSRGGSRFGATNRDSSRTGKFATGKKYGDSYDAGGEGSEDRERFSSNRGGFRNRDENFRGNRGRDNRGQGTNLGYRQESHGWGGDKFGGNGENDWEDRISGNRTREGSGKFNASKDRGSHLGPNKDRIGERKWGTKSDYDSGSYFRDKADGAESRKRQNKTEDGYWDRTNNCRDSNVSTNFRSMKDRRFTHDDDKNGSSNTEDNWDDSSSTIKTVYPPLYVELGCSLKTHMTYFASPTDFCLQLTDNKQLSDLMEKVAAVYTNGGNLLDNVTEGTACAALYVADSIWYRVLILSTDSDNVTVKFVDYGNMETVGQSDVKVLEKEFLTLPAQAINCKLLFAKPSTADWSDEEIERFSEAVDGKELDTYFVKKIGDFYEVILKHNADIVNENFGAPSSDLSEALSKPKPLNFKCNYASNEDKFKINVISPGTFSKVTVSWFVSPDYFFCQDVSSESSLKSMMDDIQISYKRKPQPLKELGCGNPVIARFSGDKVLYRAEIKEIQSSSCLVHFIDYGNYESVDKRYIWPIETKYLDLPKFGVTCALKGVKPPNGEWSSTPSNIDKFFDCMILDCTYHYCTEEKYMVSLKNGTSDISGALLKDGLAIAEDNVVGVSDEEICLELIPGQRFAAHVSYIDSVSKFFVQLNPTLSHKIQSLIENHINIEGMEVFPSENLDKKNLMCIATPDNCNWYRALVTDATNEEQINVYFIDFGDTTEIPIKQMALIPEELVRFGHQAFMCSLITNTNEVSQDIQKHFKEEVEDQDVIMYVESIDQEKLNILLFDTEGHALELLKSIVSADQLQEVEPICPLPVMSNNFEVIVSNVDDEGPTIWLQKAAENGTLAELLDLMFDFYETKEQGKIIEKFDIDQLVSAKSEVDGNWYRARITSESSEGILVLYIDYGNSECIPNCNVKVLDETFFSYHAMAFKTYLNFSVTEKSVVASEIRNITEEKECVAEIFKNDFHLFTVDLSVGGQKLSRILSKFTNTDFDSDTDVTKETESFNSKVMTVGYRCTIYISHIESPSNIWLQIGNSIEALQQFQNTLHEYAAKVEPLKEVPSEGCICIAQYSNDMLWYRASILSCDSTTATVRFLDYGNTDEVKISNNSLKPLSDDLKEKSQFATKCSMNIIPNSATNDWSPEAIQKLMELVDETSGVMDAIVLEDSETKIVDLFVDEHSVSQVLVDLGLACEDNPNHNVYVSHVNSPSQFWIQKNDSSSLLEHLRNELTAADGFDNLSTVNDGAICAALFPECEQWCRAKVISTSDEGTKVIFIDYGNHSVVRELKILPHDLANITPVATHCKLNVPDEFINWSSESTSKFKELCNEGTTLFQLKILHDSDPLIVSMKVGDEIVEDILLKYNGLMEEENVLEDNSSIETNSCLQDLQNECPIPASEIKCDNPVNGSIIENKIQAVISFLESPSSFWVHYVCENSKLDTIRERMICAINFEPLPESKVGILCAALSPKDGLWHRAKVLNCNSSDFEVQFIDYGNYSFTNELRSLSYELTIIPPSAKHCCLPLPNGFTKWSPECEQQFSQFCGGGKSVFQLTVLEEGEPNVVSLNLFGDNIENKLYNIMQNNSPVDQAEMESTLVSSLQGLDNEAGNKLSNSGIRANEKNDCEDLNIASNGTLEVKITENESDNLISKDILKMEESENIVAGISDSENDTIPKINQQGTGQTDENDPKDKVIVEHRKCAETDSTDEICEKKDKESVPAKKNESVIEHNEEIIKNLCVDMQESEQTHENESTDKGIVGYMKCAETDSTDENCEKKDNEESVPAKKNESVIEHNEEIIKNLCVDIQESGQTHENEWTDKGVVGYMKCAETDSTDENCEKKDNEESVPAKENESVIEHNEEIIKNLCVESGQTHENESTDKGIVSYMKCAETDSTDENCEKKDNEEGVPAKKNESVIEHNEEIIKNLCVESGQTHENESTDKGIVSYMKCAETDSTDQNCEKKEKNENGPEKSNENVIEHKEEIIRNLCVDIKVDSKLGTDIAKDCEKDGNSDLKECQGIDESGQSSSRIENSTDKDSSFSSSVGIIPENKSDQILDEVPQH